jgi:DNA-binding NtrC family response regulator
MRLGGNDPIKVDVRVLAATNVDLSQLVEEGRFREDLYYRLNVINLRLPSLRERWEDIPLLIEHFIEKFRLQNDKPTRAFDADATQALLAYRWPGNVRELENTSGRSVVLSPGETMRQDVLPDEIARPHLLNQNATQERSLDDLVSDYERRIILDTLNESKGSQTKSAKMLQVPLSTLNQKIKRLGIEIQRNRRNRE